jgi:hypothetical protein
MLLLNEKDISPELTKVLQNILQQITEVSKIIDTTKLKEHKPFEYLFKFCEKILQQENPMFALETCFSKDSYGKTKDQLNTIASVLVLAPNDIKVLETEYDLKYPKKLNLDKKETDLFNTSLSFAATDKTAFSEPLQILNTVKKNTYSMNLTKYFFKGIKHEKGLNHFAKKFQSNVLNHPTISLDYFNKYFNLPTLSVDLDQIEPVVGSAVFLKSFTKEKGEEVIKKIGSLDLYKQVSVKEVLALGISLNLNTANEYHYFKYDNIIYPVNKTQLILDSAPSKSDQGAIYAHKNSSYTKEKILFAIDSEKLDKNFNGGKNLDYFSTQKIRTAVLKPQPKWSPGSILKSGDSLMYIASYPKPEFDGSMLFTAVVVNPEYLGEYFIKTDLKVTPQNLNTFTLADKIDGLLFYESINSAFQQQNTQEIELENRKRNNRY